MRETERQRDRDREIEIDVYIKILNHYYQLRRRRLIVKVGNSLKIVVDLNLSIRKCDTRL